MQKKFLFISFFIVLFQPDLLKSTMIQTNSDGFGRTSVLPRSNDTDFVSIIYNTLITEECLETEGKGKGSGVSTPVTVIVPPSFVWKESSNRAGGRTRARLLRPEILPEEMMPLQCMVKET